MATRTRLTATTAGAAVRELRAAYGLTQEGLEQRTDEAGYRVDQATISLVERGRRSLTVETAVKIARGLGEPDDLLIGHATIGRSVRGSSTGRAVDWLLNRRHSISRLKIAH